MDPIAVLITRGRHVESRHAARLVVSTPDGRGVAGIGNSAEPVFPRSAVKPFQALPLVETGALDRFGGSPADLALACASHNGEPAHVERARAWLERASLSPADLRCGGHPPLYGPAEVERIERHQPATSLFNNCSGKHTGMLTVAKTLGVPLESYLERNHPVQQRVEEALCELTGLSSLPEPGVDGCGVPSWPIPLAALARAAANLASPRGLPQSRQKALGRIADAMTAHPDMVAGTGRLCTALMCAAPWIVAKTGAEGVYLAGNHRIGHGLALKVTDGATRAAEALLLAALHRLGWLEDADREALQPFGEKLLHNVVGLEVGSIRVDPDFLKALA